MYTYKDLEQLTGWSNQMLRNLQYQGVLSGDSSARPVLFDEVDARRAAWLAMLVRAHLPLSEANDLFATAIRQATKDPGVVMLLTHEGPKFISSEPKTLWELLRKEGGALHVISVGMFFNEVRKELKAIRKAHKDRNTRRLDEIEREPLHVVH